MSATLDHDLAARWEFLRAAEPRLRVRDAARRLAVSEAELVASLPGATRLRPDWAALLQALHDAGEVMALTRNDNCVHERHGSYEKVSVQGPMGLVLGEDIDLRLFLRNWVHALHVPAGQPGSPRGSVQVFDAAGEAVHKVFATEATPEGALDRLAQALAEDVPAPIVAQPRAPRAAPRPDAEIDAAGLREAWAGLRDTHDFFPMLRRFDVARRQALRLAGPHWARRLPSTVVERALSGAAAAALPVMIFVGNHGCIQIHTGPVKRLVPMGEWFNVLDPAFNLHLKTSGIEDAWLVRKPTEDGIVTAIEAFDTEGEVVLMLFGKRKPGQAEDLAWREMAEGLAA
jgi:putative hemin transport protein